MKYKRFFAFGCSFTNYYWPTWADIIAKHLDIEYYNYGIQGLGNVGIMHRIIEADLTHAFNDNDLIIVVWSDWNREDRFYNDTWFAEGGVFKSYSEDFVEKYWAIENDIVKNCTAIISANKMFNIAWQGHMIDYDNYKTYGNPKLKNQFKILFDNLPQKNLYWLDSNRPSWAKLIKDFHPDVLLHAINADTMLKQLSLKELDIKHYKHIDNLMIEDLKKSLPKLLKVIDLNHKKSRKQLGSLIGSIAYRHGIATSKEISFYSQDSKKT